MTHIKKSVKVAEFRRFAVLPEENKTETSLGLMVLAYEVAKKKGVKQIFIDLFKEKESDQNLYKRFGFKIIGDYRVFNSEVTVMVLDVENDSVYEIFPDKIERRKKFIESLKKSPELEALLFS
jgi:N-acetylglutamate synthase-like GNAT family acetyltransferase